MPSSQVTALLQKKHINYHLYTLTPALTAMEAAENAHLSGYQLAKTVIIDVDGQLAMAIMPAPYHLALEILASTIGARAITLAKEERFKSRFPDCETGAMPPCPNLYDMSGYLCADLLTEPRVAFHAGSMAELIIVAGQDFEAVTDTSVVHTAFVPPGITPPLMRHRHGRIRL